jgi:hypothetical protein
MADVDKPEESVVLPEAEADAASLSPPPAPEVPKVRKKRRHRRHRSRRWRRLRRYWPLIAGGLLVVALLAAVSTSGTERTIYRPNNTFGITFVNRATQPAQRIDVHIWWPDDSVELTYTIKDLAPGEVDVRQIYAPPGFRLKVAVRMADGTQRQGERTLSAGTLGVLRVNVHDGARLSLE